MFISLFHELREGPPQIAVLSYISMHHCCTSDAKNKLREAASYMLSSYSFQSRK